MSEFKERPEMEEIAQEAQATSPEETKSLKKKGKGLVEEIKAVVDKAGEALSKAFAEGRGGKWN